MCEDFLIAGLAPDPKENACRRILGGAVSR
jgi:hypothetical protein